jgi:phage tail sheath protein FI
VWRDGALTGATPEEAFFVQCDEETNPAEVIDAGRLVVLVGIAPAKPAEFIIFRIGQYAGGAETEELT